MFDCGIVAARSLCPRHGPRLAMGAPTIAISPSSTKSNENEPFRKKADEGRFACPISHFANVAPSGRPKMRCRREVPDTVTGFAHMVASCCALRWNGFGAGNIFQPDRFLLDEAIRIARLNLPLLRSARRKQGVLQCHVTDRSDREGTICCAPRRYLFFCSVPAPMEWGST